MARCPNCSKEIELKATGCASCKAMLSAPGGWRPVPTSPEERTEYRELNPGREPDLQVARDGPGKSLWLRFITFIGILGAGAVYGIVAHMIFNKGFSQPAQGLSGLMTTSFLVGVPFVIAMIWAVMVSRTRKMSLGRTMASSSIPIIFFVFLGGVFLREGYLCVLMALPLFIAVGLVGSFIGWAANKAAGDRSPKLLGIGLFVPFLFFAAEEQLTPPDATHQVTDSIHIEAPPDRVWRHINFPTDIRREELGGGWAYRMGVPYPIEARTLEPYVGGLRELQWERGVRFEEEITRYDEAKVIDWRYRFSPSSFPPGSLDDHVVIGGRYFDLLDTGYELIPEAGGTRLSIRVGYRVTTSFNWYAGPWAKFLVGDTAAVILRFYKQRSERA